MAAFYDGYDEQESTKILIKVCGISKTEAQKSVNCFLNYKKVWIEENSPQEVYKMSNRDGLDFLANIRLLRNLCGLDLMQAKEVIMTVDHNVKSLSEYQEKIILPELEKALEKEEKKDK